VVNVALRKRSREPALRGDERKTPALGEPGLVTEDRGLRSVTFRLNGSCVHESPSVASPVFVPSISVHHRIFVECNRGDTFFDEIWHLKENVLIATKKNPEQFTLPEFYRLLPQLVGSCDPGGASGDGVPPGLAYWSHSKCKT
jgi:hypothetical protein